MSGILAQEDGGRRDDEGEREENAATPVDSPGKIDSVIGGEFGRQHNLDERKEDED